MFQRVSLGRHRQKEKSYLFVEARVEFVKDASGTVIGLVLTQGGQTFRAKKPKVP